MLLEVLHGLLRRSQVVSTVFAQQLDGGNESVAFELPSRQVSQLFVREAWRGGSGRRSSG